MPSSSVDRPSASNDMSDQPSVLVAGPHSAAQTAAPGTRPAVHTATRPVRGPLRGSVRRHPLMAVTLALAAGALLGIAALR